ncbi:ABC-2 type transport system permease protein [Saccharopolyspora lacisalsi]|uniref:ABC-2 type transport system permease protein n=1 Tax=Halosaccharopolyspora lacisalsi TaxID=1000566 RepID=A0A839E116_9PSEU|nr:ABC transporter permease [Halosaccharopolyspora lacisalsi]MBA8827474.1 ABC-2 type transport system permease protein [Halosaccharopolyspora lacisalsi]
MQATSTVEKPPAPPESSSRTWRKAFNDIAAGTQQRQLWAHLGWQDIKQRYRRSVIGPLWITISMGMTVTALGILYSNLFGKNLGEHLPYLAVGFIMWGFISGCITDGTEVFIQNEGLMKQLPAPLSVHILRLVWRQTLLFAHNLVIYFVVLAIFLMPISWTVVMAIPAIVLMMASGAWVALLFGIVATRFRDIPPVVGSLMQLIFFMTPIVWDAEILEQKGGSMFIAKLNPLYHYIEILRDPLLGEDIVLTNWIVVGAITIVGWALALLVLRNYRARVTYWV